jgi:hypothetical protein
MPLERFYKAMYFFRFTVECSQQFDRSEALTTGDWGRWLSIIPK